MGSTKAINAGRKASGSMPDIAAPSSQVSRTAMSRIVTGSTVRGFIQHDEIRSLP
jgi:hypothetical protein